MGRMGLRLLVAIGACLCIFTGWFAAHAALALLRTPSRPLRTTVAAAPDRRWVVLTDAVLDCATQQVRQRTALVLADDTSGAHPFVAQLARRDACARSAELDGAFVGRFSRDFLRERQHLPIDPGPDLRVFSQSQAPRWLRRSLAWRLSWFALSILVTALGVRALWAPEAVRSQSTGPAKIGLGPHRD
jgi:hypothetical protein